MIPSSERPVMSAPLRLALVSAFPPGARSLNEYGLHLATGLAARDDVAEVVVIADRLPEAMAELDLGPKIRVIRAWSFNSLATLPVLMRAIRGARVDGVIWNLQTASFGDREMTAALGLLAPAAVRMLGIPSGVIAHNVIDGIDLEQTMLRGQKLRQAIVRLGGRAVNRALASASYLTVTLRGYHETLTAAYPKASLHLVPHGTFEVPPGDPAPLSARPDRIVTMGKFGTYKRLGTLLAAFDILRRNPQHAKLELVIGGTDHPNAAGYLAGLKAERRDDAGVTFAGYIAEGDVPEFFGQARLSVFDYTSTTGSSGVLHQTASHGAVPVFPRIGDFIDICEDEGIHGLNYKPQDAFDMAEQMHIGLTDAAAAQAMATSNHVAALGFPFSRVVAFHVEKIAALRTKATSVDLREGSAATV